MGKYIADYWVDRDTRSEHAKKHTERMQKVCAPYIERSVKLSKIYDDNDVAGIPGMLRVDSHRPIIEIVDAGSVEALHKYYKGGEKLAVLNFSSYQNPGGMFLKGSRAQEECLCHESFLYNVLSSDKLKEFYKWNEKHKNRALYLNRAIYSPKIIFEYNDHRFLADVITCAAPNKDAAQKYQKVSDEENFEALDSRIDFILKIANQNGVDTLILGAYGCGVFGQNPTEVARLFKEYLSRFNYGLKRVVFAIPKGNNNLPEFQKVFKQR